MATVRSVLALLWLSGCTGAIPARTASPEPAASSVERAAMERAAKYGLDLPRAVNALDWPESDVPQVALRGTNVFVDDALVDDVAEIVHGEHLKRMDGLFDALKQRQSTQPQGVVVFWFDAATTALVVKSLFQTAG